MVSLALLAWSLGVDGVCPALKSKMCNPCHNVSAAAPPLYLRRRTGPRRRRVREVGGTLPRQLLPAAVPPPDVVRALRR